MDQGNGRFKMLDANGLKDAFDSLTSLEQKMEAQKKIFSVGEEVQVKNSYFRVARITPKKLILKLLSTDERNPWPCPNCGGDAWHRDGCRHEDSICKEGDK